MLIHNIIKIINKTQMTNSNKSKDNNINNNNKCFGSQILNKVLLKLTIKATHIITIKMYLK